MRPHYPNWLVVGAGLVAACAIAGSLATAQSKSRTVEATEDPAVSEEAFARPGRTIPNRSKSTVKPHRSAPSVGEPVGHEEPAFREVQEEMIDPQGRKTIIRRRVPVFSNPTTELKSHLNQSLRECIDAYQAAPNDEAKREMEAKIEKQLGELFDLQQQERETQLKPMEDRVKKLREMLSKRAAMRNDLVQLRLKVLLQDADGMGWGQDEFLTPMRDPALKRGFNEPHESPGDYQPFRTPLSPNEPSIPSFQEAPPSRNNDTYQPASQEPGDVQDPVDLESNLRS